MLLVAARVIRELVCIVRCMIYRCGVLGVLTWVLEDDWPQDPLGWLMRAKAMKMERGYLHRLDAELER